MRLGDADDAHHSAGYAVVDAVGEVFSLSRGVAGAAGTFGDNGNAGWRDASLEKLATVRLPEIELVLLEELSAIGEFFREGGSHLLAYGVAAGADGRADCREQVAGTRGELPDHAAYPRLHDTRHGAAPARMEEGDGTLFQVDDHDGDAIGGLDAEEHAGEGGHEAVAFEESMPVRGDEGAAARCDEMGEGRVDLPEGDCRRGLRAGYGMQEATAILGHECWVVLLGPAEVEAFAAFGSVDGGHAAEASAEAVL